MSGIILEDGHGKGYKAKIDSNGDVHTFATSEDLLQNQLRQGKSYYVSAGAVDWYNGSYDAGEYVFYELYNNTGGDLLITGAQVWCGPAYTTGPYTEVADQFFRVNQWLSSTPYLNTTGNNGIYKNLNRTSTNNLPVRDNGNAPSRWARASDAVATPGSSDVGYICGFYMKAGNGGKVDMLPGSQGMVIGKSQSWIVSVKGIANASPTNMILGVRASVVELNNIGT